MLGWMFNRQKAKDESGLDGKAADKLRQLNKAVDKLLPNGRLDQTNSSQNEPAVETGEKAGRVHFSALEDGEEFSEPSVGNPDDVSGAEEDSSADLPDLGYTHRDDPDLSDEEDLELSERGFDRNVRLEILQRVQRFMPDYGPSRQPTVVREFMWALINMADSFRDSVEVLIGHDLKTTPYMTEAFSLKIKEELGNIDEIAIGAYVVLLNDSDFEDIMRGRGAFVETEAQRRITEKQQGKILGKAFSSGAGKENAARKDPTFDRFSSEENPYKVKGDENGQIAITRVSSSAQRRVANFIIASLFDTLVEHKLLRSEVAHLLRKSVRHRLDNADIDRFSDGLLGMVAALETSEDDESEEPVTKNQSKIDVAVLDCVEQEDDIRMVPILARAADMPGAITEKILESGSAKAITALAWRAGMSAAAAVLVQLCFGVNKDQVENPDENGKFDLPGRDMDWYLDFFNDLQTIEVVKNPESPVESADKTDTKTVETIKDKLVEDTVQELAPIRARRSERRSDSNRNSGNQSQPEASTEANERPARGTAGRRRSVRRRGGARDEE